MSRHKYGKRVLNIKESRYISSKLSIIQFST
jgi:hypothetical protein